MKTCQSITLVSVKNLQLRKVSRWRDDLVPYSDEAKYAYEAIFSRSGLCLLAIALDLSNYKLMKVRRDKFIVAFRHRRFTLDQQFAPRKMQSYFFERTKLRMLMTVSPFERRPDSQRVLIVDMKVKL